MMKRSKIKRVLWLEGSHDWLYSIPNFSDACQVFFDFLFPHPRRIDEGSKEEGIFCVIQY